MRKILLIALFLQSCITPGLIAQTLGYWGNDPVNLPCFNYTGVLPYRAVLPNGQQVKLPEDPWFLLGNYRLTLFTHVSGEYELITGQRAWGRMNQGDSPNSGLNNSFIDLLGNKGGKTGHYQLTGLNSLAADPHSCIRQFGCGFADYTYKTNSFTCERTLAVKPSTNPYDGTPAFLITVRIRNISQKTLTMSYTESVTAHYEMMAQQRESAGAKMVKYQNTVTLNQQRDMIKADIRGIAADPLLFPDKSTRSVADGYPPSLFLKALSAKTILQDQAVADRDDLSAVTAITLKPGETVTLRYIVGYAFDQEFEAVQHICDQLRNGDKATFDQDWRKVLPAFPKERDTSLRNEMIWHAYNLEAMATYNDYYKETQIPQGTIYDYDWGIHASARDQLQHALPLVYYNPALARSVLRYMIKRTTPLGEIKLVESGYGTAGAGSYFTSDQQLYFFQLLSEYLRVTGDYRFLTEQVENYPLEAGYKTSVLQATENCFKFLRDDIGTGQHGLVRLMNSDWNDATYYIIKAPYNRVLYKGESHMNTAMAIVELSNLAAQLNLSASKDFGTAFNNQVKLLTASMDLYRDHIHTAFFKDLGARKFSRRMYFNDVAYGDDNLFLEPQGYMLQMPDLPEAKKVELFHELQARVYKGEKLGAREQQTPQFDDKEFDKGSRENGGFWYALNGPVIIGVSMFNKPEAWRLLKNMSFGNYARSFPQYWSSYWSASDNVESSLIPMEGLPDQTGSYAEIPVYCAHPHAWLLYCYYKLTE